LTRREHRQRAGHRRLDAGEGVKHGGLFAAQRAAGDDHRAVRRELEEAQDALARPAVRGRRGQLERVELQAAGDRHPGRVGAEIGQPPRRFLALDAEPIDVGEDAADEGTDQPVARVGALARCGR
jgi:hypothetical protein